jgi:dihydroorotase
LIDPHVHFRAPGIEYKGDDFVSGSKGAAIGGFTCVLDMPNVVPPTWDVEGLQAKLACAEGRSFVDFGIYAVIGQGTSRHIFALADAGVCGYKIFMGETTGNIPVPPDGEIVDAWEMVRETGLRCGIHAEDNGILTHFREKFQRLGRIDPMVHHEARPAIAEAACISRALLLAGHAGNRLMIYHMAAKEGVVLLREARRRGIDVCGETAPHYLLLEAQDMVRRGLGTLMKVNPPIRTSDHAVALWEGLLDGTIQTIGSDHAPHSPDEKMANDRFGNVWKALSGAPGVETSVPLMLTQVNAGKLSLSKYVELQSEAPARAWNLWPRKGTLDVGSDADVTIVDMAKEGVIDKAQLQCRSQTTPFHGWRVRGLPVRTIVRGQTIALDGKIVGQPIGRLQRPIVDSLADPGVVANRPLVDIPSGVATGHQ